MRRRTFIGALMAAAAVGFGLRPPVDPQPFLDYTRKAMREALSSTKVHQDGAILTEADLERAYQACLRPPRPPQTILYPGMLRHYRYMQYWR